MFLLMMTSYKILLVSVSPEAIPVVIGVTINSQPVPENITEMVSVAPST